MMTLANYGIGSSKHKDPNSAKVLSKSLQIRNRSELLLKQCLKSHYKIIDEKRNEILNSLCDYYSRIPFNIVIWNKYQTKQCIIDSILLLDSKFNPYKAREAFRLVERMLINLVYLPWHCEFKKIHTYSGSYRLTISDPLIGIEEVLKAAGFQESTDCIMHLVLPEDKMPQSDDGESVTSVIFDCMVAQVVLSNIIDIFENCCKVPIQSEENIIDINCYSWIQAYFRERSHQTTERACSNIQELLNNITNYLAKLDTATFIKTPSLSGSSGQILDHQSSDRNVVQSNVKSCDLRGSPKLTARERTLEFLAQQSHEDDTLLTLSNDLLRIPPINKANKKVTPNSKGSEYDPSSTHRSSRPPHVDTSQQQSLLNNGYNTNQYHQQALYDRKPVESYDSVDHNSGTNNCRNSSHSLSHPVEIDTPHNDREPLIPRYDRRSISQNQLHPKQANSPYNKYESRDTDNKLTSSRSYWSCGSCTYNNQVNSEICEMCRNRRPLH